MYVASYLNKTYPFLEYACLRWGFCLWFKMKKLDTIQNFALMTDFTLWSQLSQRRLLNWVHMLFLSGWHPQYFGQSSTHVLPRQHILHCPHAWISHFIIHSPLATLRSWNSLEESKVHFTSLTAIVYTLHGIQGKYRYRVE